MLKKAKRKRRRVCNHCGRHFLPDDGRIVKQTCPWCGQETRGAQSKSVLTARADWCFSRLARFLRADRRGMVECCTCGKRKRWEEVDCGHYMSRTFRATRWDMDNCWPQCKLCNSGYGARAWNCDESVKQHYTVFLRQELDDNAPERLHRKALYGENFPIHKLRELVQRLEAECQKHGLL